jgi:uncharacterized peroxidase-related enzyme
VDSSAQAAHELSSLPRASSFERKPSVLPEYEKLSHMTTKHGSPASTNLRVVEEDQADAEVSRLYEQFRSRFGRLDLPGILKCFATHPPLLRHMMDIAEALLFAEGHLTRRHKEMIATFVSVQNHCPYCADSHSYRLRVQGGSAEALCAIQGNDLRSPSLTTAEQGLLRFVEKINRSSHGVTPGDVKQLIENGWREPQIAEAVHVAALFAAFNRIANGFGLPSQGLLALFEAAGNGGQADNPVHHGDGQ